MVVLGRRFADGADGLREMLGAAIVEIITVDRSDHHVLQPELGRGHGHVFGLVGSSACGMPVFTLQKAQARVQVSPMIMKVACFFSQHSPILGQPASSHTVTSLFSLTMARVSSFWANPAP